MLDFSQIRGIDSKKDIEVKFRVHDNDGELCVLYNDTLVFTINMVNGSVSFQRVFGYWEKELEKLGISMDRGKISYD